MWLSLKNRVRCFKPRVRGNILKYKLIFREQIFLYGEAVSNRIKILNEAIKNGGFEAINFKLAERYIETLRALDGKNIVIKADLNDPEKFIKKAQTLLKKD